LWQRENASNTNIPILKKTLTNETTALLNRGKSIILRTLLHKKKQKGRRKRGGKE